MTFPKGSYLYKDYDMSQSKLVQDTEGEKAQFKLPVSEIVSESRVLCACGEWRAGWLKGGQGCVPQDGVGSGAG